MRSSTLKTQVDTIHTIRRSAQKFFSGTALSRLSGMLRDVSMAYAFGTNPSIAAFMLSFRLAHSLRRLFGEGALQSAFIPEFEAIRHNSPQQAFSFFRNLTAALSLILTLIIAFSAGILSLFLAYGNLSTNNQEIVSLTLTLLPSLLFICLYGLYASLLQCERIYFIPSASPIAFNTIWIICVLLLNHLPAQEAMPYLAYGVVFACLAQWVCTYPQTRLILKQSLTPFSWRSIQLNSPTLRKFAQRLFLGIIGVAASQINNVVDSIFARIADPEGPAYLWYAIRIQQLPLALFGVALSGAILPPISRAIKAQKTDEFHQFLQYAIRTTWLFMLPLTALLLAMGDQIVHLVFGWGEFGLQSIMATTSCLWAYSFGLIPSALILVLASACYGQNNYCIPALISIGTMLLNSILNAIFIFFFNLGAISIALATSISAWINLALLYRHLSHKGALPTIYAQIQEHTSSLVTTLLAMSITLGFRLYILQNLLILTKYSSPFLLIIKLIINLVIFFGLILIFRFILSTFLKNPSQNGSLSHKSPLSQ